MFSSYNFYKNSVVILSLKKTPAVIHLYNLYVHDNQSPVTIHKFIYYNNTDNTGTQCVLLFFFNYIFSSFFFNLICMLKKSQLWVCLQLQNQSRS